MPKENLVFLRSPDGNFSLPEIAGWADNIAIKFREHGLKPGDRIAITAPNSAQYISLLLAIWQVGAIATPINTRFSAEQILDAITAVGATIFLHSTTTVNSNIPGCMSLNLAEFPGQPSIVDSQKFSFRDWLAKPENHTKLATIIFTSGSSGKPRAAVHSFGNHYFSALGANQNIPFGAGDDCWLLALPLYHVGGLAIVFRAITGGGAIAIPAPETSLAAAIRSLGVTHISLVATQLFRLLQTDSNIPLLQKMTAILLGGSAIPKQLIAESIRLKLPIHTSYGSTEMSSQITATPQNATAAELSASGKLLNFRELRIEADGEICVGGKTLFRGYWTNGSCQQPFTADGFFRTGDTGKIDGNGFLHVTGRKNNMFISGGENIQPETIEAALNECPGVRQSLVVPVPDNEFGQRPVAFVETDTPLNEVKILDFLAKKLARFELPLHIFPWPQLPDSGGIKLSRRFFETLAIEKRDEVTNISGKI